MLYHSCTQAHSETLDHCISSNESSPYARPPSCSDPMQAACLKVLHGPTSTGASMACMSTVDRAETPATASPDTLKCGAPLVHPLLPYLPDINSPERHVAAGVHHAGAIWALCPDACWVMPMLHKVRWRDEWRPLLTFFSRAGRYCSPVPEHCALSLCHYSAGRGIRHSGSLRAGSSSSLLSCLLSTKAWYVFT